MNENRYSVNNIFYLIIEFNNEYYIVNTLPHFWYLLFGPIRSLLFLFCASKIPPEELEKYRVKKTGVSYAELGLGSFFTGITVYISYLVRSMEGQIQSGFAAFLIVIGYIVLFRLLYYFYTKGGLNKIKTYDYKVKFKMKLNKKSIKTLLAFMLFLWIGYLGNIYILLELKKEMFPIKDLIFMICILVIYFFCSCTLYGEEYGTISVVPITEDKKSKRIGKFLNKK